jgi:acetoin utilization protein AcuB
LKSGARLRPGDLRRTEKMLVKKWMSKEVICVSPDDSMQLAANLMKEHDIRLVPVMKGKKLEGILSDGDLKKASASIAGALDVRDLLYHAYKTKIKDIMTKDVITVPFDQTVDEAAQVLQKNKISGAPVVDHKAGVVGVITKDDIFNVLISLTAMGSRGIQLAFHVKDQPGSIKELTDLIRHYGGRVASILCSFENAPPGHRNVYIRMFNLDRSRLAEMIQTLKEKANMLYMVDHRENKREIYE